MNFFEGEPIRQYKLLVEVKNVDLGKISHEDQEVSEVEFPLLKSENLFFQVVRLGKTKMTPWRFFIVSGGVLNHDIIGLVNYDQMVYFEGVIGSGNNVITRRAFEICHSVQKEEDQGSLFPGYAFFSGEGSESHEDFREDSGFVVLDVNIDESVLVFRKKEKLGPFALQVENQIQMIKRVKFEIMNYESLQRGRIESNIFELKNENEMLKKEITSLKKNQKFMLSQFQKYDKRIKALENNAKTMMQIFKQKFSNDGKKQQQQK